ncbi:hypothetical protein [Massilia sp. PWRC2]|uniref:hypothetical protein n=1 Tax=Massilia sp. PWRC2 TaxID=2804626 RepID=UPI003CEAB0CD
MNTFNKAVAAAHLPRPSKHARSDARSRDIVDHAIVVQETANTMAAVEYLKSHDVAAHVIERVLLDPQRRRTALPA